MALTRSKDSCCVPCHETLIDMQLSSTCNRERLCKSAYGCAAGLDLSILLLFLWPTRTPGDEITHNTQHVVLAERLAHISARPPCMHSRQACPTSARKDQCHRAAQPPQTGDCA